MRVSKKTEKEVVSEFLKNLDNFQTYVGISDGKISLIEFEDFFSYLSAAIESNNYFELMCINCWNLPNSPEDVRKNPK